MTAAFLIISIFMRIQKVFEKALWIFSHFGFDKSKPYNSIQLHLSFLPVQQV